ncbi:MAG: hypothetical protein JWM95_1555 [Gemmatimonadetes bacterium]|nr:hypothetical protein [Gemmatimonadota bacterium]
MQPDLLVVPAVGGKRQSDNVPVTSLTLAIEVVSPGSAHFDRVTKRRAYQRAGVAEYWIVDSDARTIERWQPADVRPDIADAILSWNPAGAAAPFVPDVRQFFADVSDEDPDV